MARVSRFGEYTGFAEVTYDGFVRRSVYVPARDGVHLAIDYFVPTIGEREARALPVIFQMTPYNRAQVIDGRLVHALAPYEAGGSQHANNLIDLCRAGYVIAVADVRGQGASFGVYAGCMSAEEGSDGADLIAWLRAQPFCNGRTGMLGSSYGASTQFLVATERPAGLQALYLCHTFFDAYDVFFPGGVRQVSLPRDWGRMVDELAGRIAPSTVAPVDGPDGPALLAAAIEDHKSGPGASAIFAHIYAQSTREPDSYFGNRTQTGSQNLALLLSELNAAAIPAYHHGGWNDYCPDQTAMWFANWKGAPAKLVIGPWTHSPRTFTSPRDYEDIRIRSTESRRWFDYWLNDIDNGILDEPPIHYAVQSGHRFRAGAFESDDDHWDWRSAPTWPLENVRSQTLYLARGPSGTVASHNDGILSEAPDSGEAEHVMTVDPTVTTGPHNRMGSSFVGAPQRFPEMSAQDARCLTWTSAPLAGDVVLAGAPRLRIRVRSTHADGNLFAWLEGIDTAGRSTLLTYGILRASHRSLGEAPYETAGVLWRPSTLAATKSVAGLDREPGNLTISLLPLANRFAAGTRIRLTLSGADDGNYEGFEPGATIAVVSSPGEPPALELPLLDGPVAFQSLDR